MMGKCARLAGTIVVLGVLGFVSGVEAAPIVYEDFSITVADEYWGGNNQYNNAGPYGDIIANDVAPADLATSSKFSVIGMSVSKVANALTVTINTNYAGTVGNNNIGFLNTVVGSLFLGVGEPSYNVLGAGPGTGVAPYKYDTFVGDEGRFDYAFVPGLSSSLHPATSSNTAELKPLNQLTGALSDVQLSYYPTTATTTGSNFRTNQAVGYKGVASSIASGDWQVMDSTHIRFTIEDFFGLSQFTGSFQSALTLAWAMSCANDVMVTTIGLTQKAPALVPLPAGLVLLLSGLFGIGILGRVKSKLKLSLH